MSDDSAIAISETTRALPVIDVDQDLRYVTAEAWVALLSANDPPRLFRQGNLLVRLEVDDGGRVCTRPLTIDRLKHELARVARWPRSGRGPAVPPEVVCRDILASPDPALPRLTQITAAPIFAPSGSLQTTPGYCPESGAYYQPPKGFSLRPISEKPSQAEVDKARYIITNEVLGDFPFVGDADLATAVSAMITPFARGLIADPTPPHVFDKPTHRTGTSRLAAMCAIPINGPECGVLAPADSEGEWRKRITANLVEMPPTITIDNAPALD